MIKPVWPFVVGLLMLFALQDAGAFSMPQRAAAQAATKRAYVEFNAAQGQPDAQFLPGLWYLSGKLVAQDTQLGLQWIKRAAQAGQQQAAQTLADLAFEGKLMPRDLGLAEHWYLRLGDEDKWAQFRLGFIYAAGGPGVARNCAKAVKHFLAVGDKISLGNVVWILSTCSEAKYRDGKRALAIGKSLVADSSQDATNLDNLAAAYAEVGDYTQAVAVQKRAIAALKQTQQYDKADEEAFELRLHHYLQHKPYREAVPLEP